jgi:leucyl aminopeptidase
MKINYINPINSSENAVVIPVFESVDSIQFKDILLTAKVFSGKKDTNYLVEKNGIHYLFLGVGKSPNYKEVKTVFRRFTSKNASFCVASVSIIFSADFSVEMIEAAVSGLQLGT